MPFTVLCETSNATVLGLCCSQAQAQYQISVNETTSAFVFGPSGNTISTCTWNVTSNSTGQTEVNAWLNCAAPYDQANLTFNTGCGVLPNAARGVGIKGHLKWISGLTLVGMAMQAILAV